MCFLSKFISCAWPEDCKKGKTVKNFVLIFPELFPACETEHLAQIFAENRIAEKLFRQSFGRRKEDRQVDRQDRHAEYLDRQEIKRQAE